MGIQKSCEACGRIFTVPPSLARIRACSQECGYKIRRIDREALSYAGRKGGLVLKGRRFPGRTNSGSFEKGHKRNLGRSRPDMRGKNNVYYRLSEEQRKLIAEKHSQILRGRENPQHGEFLRRFYLEHPEKHPNLVMAHDVKFGAGYISKGQYDLYLEIKKAYPDAELNYPIRTHANKLYFADVALPSHKTVIEYDGDYWHKEEEDKIRDFNLQEEGWHVIRIKESEYNGRAPELLEVLAEDRM